MADKDVKVDVTVNDNTGPGMAKVRRSFDDLDKRRTKSNKSAVTDVEKTAEGVAGLLESVSNKAAGFLDDKLGGVLKGLPPQVQTGIVAGIAAGAAAGAPILVETLSTALSLSAGGGFLLAGIILAARDPAVQAAYGALGKNILARLNQSVLPFREELLTTATDVQTAFDGIGPGLDATFAALAPEVRDVVDGLLKAGTNALPGVERAAQSSIPLFHELSEATARWGDELGELFGDVARSGPGMQLLFHFILLNVDAAIMGIDALVKSVGPAFNVLAGLTNALGLSDVTAGADAYAHVGRNIGAAGLQAQEAAPDFAALSAQVEQTAQNADTLAAAMVNKVLSATLGLDQANLSFAESLTGVSKALKDNKLGLDIHTEAGQADRSAVLQSVSANIAQYNALIQAGAGADEAAAAYDANTQALEHQLRQAGLTGQQIDGLIGKYRNVPDSVNTNIAMQGLTDAINGLANLIRQLNGINGKTFNSTVTTTYKTVGHPLTGEGGTIPLHSGSAFSGIDGWQARADNLSLSMAGGSRDSSGAQRTGGPRELTVRNVINIDGARFREWTDQRIDEALDRAASRQKVGRR